MSTGNSNKENLGLKRDPKNPNDERFDMLDAQLNAHAEDFTVEIANTMSGEYFSRRVLDVTLCEGTYIISW